MKSCGADKNGIACARMRINRASCRSIKREEVISRQRLCAAAFAKWNIMMPHRISLCETGSSKKKRAWVCKSISVSSMKALVSSFRRGISRQHRTIFRFVSDTIPHWLAKYTYKWEVRGNAWKSRQYINFIGIFKWKKYMWNQFGQYFILA